jgi:hypothetical protein
MLSEFAILPSISKSNNRKCIMKFLKPIHYLSHRNELY